MDTNLLTDIMSEIKDAQDEVLTMRPEDTMHHLINAESLLRELMYELGVEQ